MEKSEMERMQRDAENRMREMKARSDRIIKGDVPPMPDFVSTVGNKASGHNKHDPPPQKEDKPAARRGTDLLKMLNFEKLKIDNDVMLIIVLIFLLSADDCDELLLLALIYIML